MAPLTTSPIDPERARETASQVLAQPRYAPAQPGLGDRILDFVAEIIANFLRWFTGPSGSGIGVVLLIVIVIVVIAAVALLVRRVRRDPGRRGAQPGRIGGRTATDWRRAAERNEADGNLNEALRCYYRALLADLVEAGLIDEVAGRTARGYLRDMNLAAPGAGQPMTAVTLAFEDAWYGHRLVDADDVAAMRQAAAEVRRAMLVHQ